MGYLWAGAICLEKKNHFGLEGCVVLGGAWSTRARIPHVAFAFYFSCLEVSAASQLWLEGIKGANGMDLPTLYRVGSTERARPWAGNGC